ncbi:MAG: LysM peptidoglycan-binding domain-containing protein [Aeromicrobium sp.]
MRLSSTGYAVSAISAISLGVFGPATGDAAREVSSMDFDRSLAAVATLILVALSVWTLTCIGLAVASEKSFATGALARLITPRFVRRALFLGAAGAFAIGPASAVNDAGRGVREPGQSTVSRSLDGLRLPDRPFGSAPAVSDLPHALAHIVRVERGDTLWSIAAQNLGPGASNPAIDMETKRWYEENSDVIGPDPDLIYPFQRLTIPTKESR